MIANERGDLKNVLHSTAFLFNVFGGRRCHRLQLRGSDIFVLIKCIFYQNADIFFWYGLALKYL